jgi:hypothetical protein
MNNKLIYILAGITIVTWTLEAFVDIPNIFPIFGIVAVVSITLDAIYKQLKN